MPPRRELIPEPTAIEMIRQFNKLKRPKFEGGGDPMVYDEWLRRMEDLFEIMECHERFRGTWPPINLKRSRVLVGDSET